jgi:hypothetical protein
MNKKSEALPLEAPCWTHTQFQILSSERGKRIYWYTAACNLLAGENMLICCQEILSVVFNEGFCDGEKSLT